MHISVSTLLAALFCLCAPAYCAPTAGHGLQDTYANLRKRAMDLNDIAKKFFQTQNGTKEESPFTFTLPWMEANDLCDPKALKDSSLCIGKILGVLRSYQTTVKRLEEIQTCSDFACEVLQAMKELEGDLNCFVKSRRAAAHVKEFNMTEVESQHIDQWQEAPLCSYVKERLFSFSVFTARVFATGDPALHSGDSAPKCA